MTKDEQEFMNKLIEENKNFRKLVRYTIEDIDDLYWDYDRMSESGQKTLDNLMGIISQQCWDRDGNECECGKYNGWLGCTK